MHTISTILLLLFATTIMCVELKQKLWYGEYTNTLQSRHLLHLPKHVHHPVTTGYTLQSFKDLPASYDVHQLYGTKCKEAFAILNQGQCGSCWAFGSIESLGDRVCTTLGVDVRLSEQYLLACDGMDSGCMGGDQGNAWKFFMYFGAPSSKCVNYTSGDHPNDPMTCPSKCDDGSVMTKYYASSAYAIDAYQEAIMREIYTHGSVVTGYTVYSDFDAYKGGIYHHVEGRPVGGHAVSIVGWGSENGVPYWRVRNSWGPSWGENGYFRILRGTNECGIEDSVVAGIPTSTPVPPVAPVMPLGVSQLSRSVKTQFELTLTNYHMILNGTGANYWSEPAKGRVYHRFDSFNGAAAPSTEIIYTADNVTIEMTRVLQRKTCQKTPGYDSDSVTIPSQGLVTRGAKFIDYQTMNGVVVLHYNMAMGPMVFDWYVTEDADHPGQFVPIKTVSVQTSKTSVMKNTMETVWYIPSVDDSMFVPQC